MAQQVESSIIITFLPLNHSLHKKLIIGPFVRLSKSSHKGAVKDEKKHPNFH